MELPDCRTAFIEKKPQQQAESLRKKSLQKGKPAVAGAEGGIDEASARAELVASQSEKIEAELLQAEKDIAEAEAIQEQALHSAAVSDYDASALISSCGRIAGSQKKPAKVARPGLHGKGKAVDGSKQGDDDTTLAAEAAIALASSASARLEALSAAMQAGKK